MKFISFTLAGKAGYGIVTKEGVIDAGSRLAECGDLSEALADSARLALLANEKPDYDLADVRLAPPIPNCRRIVCIGLNYKSHIVETNRDTPSHPILFPRYPSSLVGDGENLVRPRVSEQFDFEGELAVVIGRRGRYIQASHAMEHVAGYSCFNDGSIRDFQRHTSQFMPGKNFERTGSFGPWLVTPDEVGDVNALRLATRLNGEVVQSASISDLLFGVEALIAYVSQIWEVQPGDVIATGTTGGVGVMRKPPLWMKPGDRIEVEIDRLGVLQNAIVAE
jgi:2-keto-4-pentenoate hydratase/2-oxohepta-3-ene-1,7-dioic acid hydratase in catechol pathway